MQRALTAAGEWCTGKGFNLNANQTTIVPLTGKRSLTLMEPIFLDGTEIQIASETQYLGVIFVRKLLWKPSIMICRRLDGKSWGCSPSHVRWMYTIVVKPITTYGVIALSKRMRLKTNQASLSQV